MPSLSVALATYNGARFIREQLESLARQTRPPDEIVVSDDQSNDGTIAEVERFRATTAIPIKLTVNPERFGYGKNFMNAAALCSSDLIAFCDQDDVWSADKLVRVELAFADPDVLMVHHNAWLVDAGMSRLGAIDESVQPSEVTVTGPMGGNPWLYPLGFTQTFRRELLLFSPMHDMTRELFSGPGNIAHDYWIAFLAASLGKIVYIADKLVDYRQHGANVFGRDAPARATFSSRLQRISALQTPNFDKLLQFCETYERVLGAVAEADYVPVGLRERGDRARRRFQTLSIIYGQRRAAYRADTLTRRAAAFLSLVKQGAYGRSNAWSFGWKSAVRDIVVGVVLGHLSRRAGRYLGWSDWSLRSNAPIPLT